MEYIPYTYLIGWLTIDKWYYGVEYGFKKTPCANPINLWTTYFTSSSTIDKFRKKYGEPDVIDIQKVFNTGEIEERMINACDYEKNILNKIDITNKRWLNGRIGGNICPENNRKIAQNLYGVENVFSAECIKEKIKKTNLKKYKVEHPSHSKELLDRKKENNMKKYGVSCTFQLPHSVEKMIAGIKKPETKEKKAKTNMERYGGPTPTSCPLVRKKMADTRKKLSNRPQISLIREYKRIFGVKIPRGLYQRSEDKLDNFLLEIQTIYGFYELNEIKLMEKENKYKKSIKRLMSRNIVITIKKYKERFSLKLPRGWERKSDDFLTEVLKDLVEKYGFI